MRISRASVVSLSCGSFFAAMFLVGIVSDAGAREKSQVKLILQITVDGLRGDLLNRYSGQLGNGGFRYLLDKGAVYANAHYSHANTETIVGHATLATGASPSEHGMVGNVWFDRDTGKLSYNIEDPNSPLLPSRKEKVEASQLDPAQKISRTKGRSPVSILASTFSDELAVHYAGRSRTAALSQGLAMRARLSGIPLIQVTTLPVATITTPIRTGWCSGTRNGCRRPTPASHGIC